MFGVRSNRTRREAAHRDHWTGSEDYSSPIEVNPATGRFLRNEDQPMDCNLLIVDETSMVDVLVMYALLAGERCPLCPQGRNTELRPQRLAPFQPAI
jgi:hypothetical protein